MADDDGGKEHPIMIRMSAGMVSKLDARARLEKRSRAEIVRLLVAFGMERMPQGWVR